MSQIAPIKTIVMTGATRGLGAHALKQFVAEPGRRVLIGARGVAPEGVEAIPLDLASLESVRSFAAEVTRRLAGTPIDVLVLNAGAQFRKTPPPRPDGLEATFAVNHVAHYLLVRLLLPNIAEGGRIVITTSDTHDPAIFPFGPKVLDVQQLAHPQRSGMTAGARAYAASKLCNLLTARALAALEDVKARRIHVVAYNPGATLGTNLGNSESPGTPAPPGAFLRGLLMLVSRFYSAAYPGTPERSGEALAQLALGQVAPPEGRVYASLVKGEITFPDPSKVAQSDEARDRLWRETATMVGLS